MLDNAVDGARLSGNVQALAGDLLNRSLTAVAAGNIDLALSTAQETVELTEGWTKAWLPRPAWPWPQPSSRPVTPVLPSTSSFGRRAAKSSRSFPACGGPGPWSC